MRKNLRVRKKNWKKFFAAEGGGRGGPILWARSSCYSTTSIQKFSHSCFMNVHFVFYNMRIYSHFLILYRKITKSWKYFSFLKEFSQIVRKLLLYYEDYMKYSLQIKFWKKVTRIFRLFLKKLKFSPEFSGLRPKLPYITSHGFVNEVQWAHFKERVRWHEESLGKDRKISLASDVRSPNPDYKRIFNYPHIFDQISTKIAFSEIFSVPLYIFYNYNTDF